MLPEEGVYITGCWSGTTRNPQSTKYVARPHEKGTFRWQRQPGNHPVPWLRQVLADHIGYATSASTCISIKSRPALQD